MARIIFGLRRRIFLKLLLFAIFLATPIIGLTQNVYYVDSTIGNDSNSCDKAQNPATPKRTVNGVMSCNPGPGDIVKFRGTFTQTISPTRSGEILYPFQPIQGVSGSTVTFSNSISGLNSATDYVTIYNSRKGNSGAFAVKSFSANSVTVDTSDLPLGSFITESAADPGDLHGAILRPVHFTAWDKNNPPVFDTSYQTFYSNGKAIVMASYLHSISGKNHQVWPAIEIDSLNLTDSDYIIFDHLEIENAATGIAVEYRNFKSNYDIIQHNYIHDTGYQGGASDEMIYFGCAYQPGWHHDYAQIMYNKIGPHRFTTGVLGDGIEIKPSAHNATVWGNEIMGIVAQGPDDSPLKTSGTNTVVGNNYIHDIDPINYPGCGISILDDYPSDPNGGASGSIVMNNIVANVEGVGIKILDASNVKVLNNVVYNITRDLTELEKNWGIGIQNWQGSTENIVIKNNIVHSAYIGIGRYIWSKNYPVSIDSDYNLVFNTTYPFRGNITKNTHDLVLDPMFFAPKNGDFHLQSSSPAIDNGNALSDVAIDFDSISRPQYAGYDIGAYEYNGTNPSLRAIASGNPTSGAAPLTVNFSGSASSGTSPYTYSWVFGDDGSSTAQNPSHTYSSIGTYTATLTVRDSASATASKSVSIIVTSTVTPLSANASASPTSGQAPLTVAFTGSASGGVSPYTYSWVFGDGGSSTAQNPSHTYSSAATYTATLTVRDSTSATASKSVTITVSAAPSPLTANASASPTSGQAPLTVTFTGSASGGTSPYTYSWSFGDGGSSTSRSPSHTYSSAGTYTATLTVRDSASATASKSVTITVGSAPTPLAASATAAPTSGLAPLTVNFTGNATGGTAPYSYSWDFGDGNSDLVQNPSHIYFTLGNYVATLTVTDYYSQSANATINISVVSNSTVLLGITAETGAPARGQGGTTDPSPGNHTYSIGSTVSLKSIPNTDYRFSKWAGDIIHSSLFNATTNLTMDTNKSLSSTFCTMCADVNGDLKITPGDAQAAFDIYLRRIKSPTWCELENADVNCSGTKLSPQVTPADAQMIFRKFLRRGIATSDCSGLSRKASFSLNPASLAAVHMTIDNIAFIPGQDILVPIIIESPSELTAFGFDLAFPSDILTYIGMESTELTAGYDQLDANVTTSQAPDQEQADGEPLEIPILRVGGYKSNSFPNPSSGILVTLVFRVTGEFRDPSPISVIATYDDIQDAVIRNGLISRQNNLKIRENTRSKRNVEKARPNKR